MLKIATYRQSVCLIYNLKDLNGKCVLLQRITYGNMVPKWEGIRFNILFIGIRDTFVNEDPPH